MKRSLAVLVCLAALSAACHNEPVIGGKAMNVGGTIAGIVKTSDSSLALPGRRISAVDVSSGVRRDTTTGADGGYTIQVPVGTYRLDIELHEGETLAKQPEPTHITNGDLDPHRDFVLIIRGGGTS